MAKFSEKHVHKFKRLKYKSGNTIFFCALPDCAQKINISLALGKRSICWRCNSVFIMDEYTLRLSKPHCQNCHKPKNPIIQEVISKSEPPSLSERLQQIINEAPKEEHVEEDI